MAGSCWGCCRLRHKSLQGRKLWEGRSFHLFGDFNQPDQPSKAQLISLLVSGGATIIPTLPQGKQHNTARRRGLCDISSANNRPLAEVQGDVAQHRFLVCPPGLREYPTADVTGLLPISSLWLLDSVSLGKLHPVSGYLMDNLEDTADLEPDPLTNHHAAHRPRLLA